MANTFFATTDAFSFKKMDIKANLGIRFLHIHKPQVRLDPLASWSLKETAKDYLDKLKTEEVEFNGLTDEEVRELLQQKLLTKAGQISGITRNLNERYLDDTTRALLSNEDIYRYVLYYSLGLSTSDGRTEDNDGAPPTSSGEDSQSPDSEHQSSSKSLKKLVKKPK